MSIFTREPVRLYSIAAALVAIGAYFVPSGAWPLVLALVAAVVGGGVGVRSQVTPIAAPDTSLLDRLREDLPEADDIPTTGSPED